MLNRLVGRYMTLSGAGEIQASYLKAHRMTCQTLLVLLLYDYFLTFALELQYIWHGKPNIIKILFIMNRYSSLMFQYSFIVLDFLQPITTVVCPIL